MQRRPNGALERLRVRAEAIALALAWHRRARLLRRAPVPSRDPEGYLDALRDSLSAGAFPVWSPVANPAPGALIGWDGRARMLLMDSLARQVLSAGVPGDFVEAGVYRGGMSVYLAGLLRALGGGERRLWALDSFKGCPAPEDLLGSRFARAPQARDDARWAGRYACSIDSVRSHFAQHDLLDDRVRLVQGMFHETLPSTEIERVSLLHIDADLYSSTAEVLEHLYPKLSPGGFVVFDDYGFPECRRAVHDLRSALAVTTPIRLAATRWPVAYWQKTPAQGA